MKVQKIDKEIKEMINNLNNLSEYHYYIRNGKIWKKEIDDGCEYAKAIADISSLVSSDMVHALFNSEYQKPTSCDVCGGWVDDGEAVCENCE